MDHEERIKILKQACTAAKTKLTTVKKTLLNTLLNTRTPETKVNASEKDFQDAFAALNEAHSQYVAAKDEEDNDPQDSEYMEGRIADQMEVEEKWTEWHVAKDEIQRAAISADMAKQRAEERDHAKDVEEHRRAADKLDAADRATKAKEDKAKSLAVRL